jgi:hypothetical protein
MKAYSGTTLFSIVTTDGIVVGADSLAGGKDGHTETLTKLHAVGRGVIACEGLGALQMSKFGAVDYRADEWMKEVERCLSVEADAHTIARYIATAHPFLEMFKVEKQAYGLIQHNDWKGYLAEFLVASASEHQFSVLAIRASVRHEQWTVEFTTTLHFDGMPPINSFVRHGVGRIAEIDKAFSRNGDAYYDMLTGTDGSFERLIEGQVVSLYDLRDVVRCALRLETKANPQFVGPPFVIATLQPSKLIEIVTYTE